MLVEYLEYKKFSKKAIARILASNGISNNSKVLLEKAKKNIAYLEGLDIPKKRVIKMVSDCPTILSFLPETLVDKIDDLSEFGYKKKTIKMIKGYSAILSYAFDTIKKKFKVLTDFGLSKEQALTATACHPKYFCHPIEVVQDRLDGLLKLKFSKEDVIYIVYMNVRVLDMATARVEEHIKDIEVLGFTNEEALAIASGCPSLLSSNSKTLSKKIELLLSLGLRKCILDNPSILMQGVPLTTARVRFFKEQGITIDETNYRRVFRNSVEFKARYGISNEDVLKLYGPKIGEKTDL